MNDHWRLEKKTNYILPAGTTCTHTVNLPAMYIKPEEMAPVPTGTLDDYYSYKAAIPGKTRHIMFIIHGQLGYEGATGAGNNARLEYVPAVMNVKYRQITKLRICEHGQKRHIMWTGCNDLTTDATEHTALTNPTIMVEDPADAAPIADQDT